MTTMIGKIESFDPTICKSVSESVMEALKPLEESYGVTFQLGNGSYDSNSYKFRINCLKLSKDGEPICTEKEDFKKYCNLFGLEESDLGKTFKCRNNIYKLYGLKPRNRKYPVLAKDVMNGKIYKFSAYNVKSFLGRKNG